MCIAQAIQSKVPLCRISSTWTSVTHCMCQYDMLLKLFYDWVTWTSYRAERGLVGINLQADVSCGLCEFSQMCVTCHFVAWWASLFLVCTTRSAQSTSINWLYCAVSELHSAIGLSLLQARWSGTHCQLSFAICLSVMVFFSALLRRYYCARY